MSKLHVRKGDTVKILAGKDKGKTGKITMVDPDNARVVVDNLNMMFKHQKGRGQGQQSQILKIAGSIDASNVQIICPACAKPTRVAHTPAAVGKKFIRACKHCGATLDVKEEKKVEKKGKKVKKEDKPEAAADKPESGDTGGKKPVRKSAKPKIEKNEDGAVV